VKQHRSPPRSVRDTATATLPESVCAHALLAADELEDA
jgi:hypothetical protein